MTHENGRPDDADKIEADEKTLDEPVMDGADDKPERGEDPRKGLSDPALVRHPDKGDKTVAPYNF